MSRAFVVFGVSTVVSTTVSLAVAAELTRMIGIGESHLFVSPFQRPTISDHAAAASDAQRVASTAEYISENTVSVPIYSFAADSISAADDPSSFETVVNGTAVNPVEGGDRNSLMQSASHVIIADPKTSEPDTNAIHLGYPFRPGGSPSLSVAVPEPSVWALMLVGAAMVGGRFRLARRRPANTRRRMTSF